MKTSEETEVVTIGLYEDRKFDGIVVNGNYYSKGDARNNKDNLVKSEYRRARRAINGKSKSLEDSPRRQYKEDNKYVWHHNLTQQDL